MTNRSSRRRTDALLHRVACEALESRSLFSVSLLSAVPLALSTTPLGDPAAPITGDFDADADTDVVVAFPSPSAIEQGYIQYGQNDGSGTLTLGQAVPVGIFTGRPVAGDFDGDGNLDLAFTNAFDGNIFVVKGNGNGSFGAAQTFDAGVSPESIAVGDFNSDTRADLAIGNRGDNTVDVYFGDAAATLTGRVTLNTAADPASVAIADFNADERPDLLVGASGGVGAGFGTLQTFLWTVPLADTDDDGIPDSPSGEPPFLNPTPIATPGPRGVTAVGDIDGDRLADVVVGVSDRDRADALINNGNATFSLIRGATGSSGTKSAIAVDMDEDTDLDLVTAVGGVVEVLVNDGVAQFSKPRVFDAGGGSGPAVADLNGDGRADVLTIAATPGVTAGRTLNINIGERLGPDFSVQIISGVPTAAISGDSARVTLRVTNNGNEGYKGNLPLRIILSTDTLPDSGDDNLVLQAFPRVSIRAGQSKNIRLRTAWDVDNGTYNVLAQVDAVGSAGDLNLLNNLGSAAAPIVVAAPFVDLTGVLGSLPANAASVGQTLRPDITVTNSGNVTARGPMTVVLLASPDQTPGEGDVILQTLGKNVRIAPGRSVRLRFRFRVPSLLTPGSYFMLGLVNESGTIGEPDPDNNVAIGGLPLIIQ
jgi:hypothetical protein